MSLLASCAILVGRFSKRINDLDSLIELIFVHALHGLEYMIDSLLP